MYVFINPFKKQFQMINYVNNAYDKCLKPCDAQQFSNIINSPKTEELITLYRSGDSRAKSNLPALTYMGVFDKGKWPPSNPPQGGRYAQGGVYAPHGTADARL